MNESAAPQGVRGSAAPATPRPLRGAMQFSLILSPHLAALPALDRLADPKGRPPEHLHLPHTHRAN